MLLDIDFKAHVNHPSVLLLFSWIKFLLLQLQMYSSQLSQNNLGVIILPPVMNVRYADILSYKP